MSWLRKLALLVGITFVTNGTALVANAQTCRGAFQIPLTRARANQLAGQSNIPAGKVSKAFENFAIDTIQQPPIGPVPRNTQYFSSPLRWQLTRNNIPGERYRNVVPDGVLPLTVINPPGTYPQSVFFEAKALTEYHEMMTSDYPLYGARRWQIAGFIDALTYTSAGIQPNEIPALVFLTTYGVIIDPDVLSFATSRKVGILQAIACEDLSRLLSPNKLQMGEAKILNNQVYFNHGRIAEPPGPGTYGRLMIPPNGQVPDQDDEL